MRNRNRRRGRIEANAGDTWLGSLFLLAGYRFLQKEQVDMRRNVRWAVSVLWLLSCASTGCVPEAVGRGFTSGITNGVNDIVVGILTSLVLGQS